MTDEYEMRVLGYQTVFSPDYPREGARELIPIHERMEAAKSLSMALPMILDGREVEVVVRQPQHLKGVKLFHITPATVLAQRLRVFQGQALVFIALSCLFCLSLGAILIRRFLVPLYALSDGILALRRKQFDHRVRIASKDEIGDLGRVLNKTIEHMKNMEMASSLQTNLHPQERLEIGDFEIISKNVMTQAIGGDYFDSFPLPDGRVIIILGDVSGHGVSAALVAAMAKSGFSLLCPMFHRNPVEIMQNINRLLLQLVKRQKMMSCVLAILDPEKETLTAINAGQCFPILIDRDGRGSFLEIISSPLGMMKTGRFGSCEVSLRDQQLVLYSDGLAEAMNASNKPLGYDRFAQIASRNAGERSVTPTEAIFRDVREFSDPVPWGDDATVIIIRKRARKE